MKKLLVVAVVLAGCSSGDRGTASFRIKQLTDSDSGVRRMSAMALGELGPEASAAVPALCVALKDKDKDVRRQAANALGRIGDAARAAIPPLTELLSDTDDEVRRSAADALRDIDPDVSANGSAH